MPKRFSRTDLALGTAAFVLIAVAIALGALALVEQQRGHRQGYKDAPAYQADNGEQQRETLCVGVAVEVPQPCVSKTPSTESDAERAQRDLRAQEEMADWALGMFFVAVVGAITTIVGLVYIVRAYYANVEATRHAAKAANAATKANARTRAQFIAERRPWLSCRTSNVNAQIVKKVIIISVDFTLTNHGQTPATGVDIRLNKVGAFDKEHKTLFEHMTQVERHRPKERGGDVVFPGESASLTLQRDFKLPADYDGPPPTITGWVRYWFEGTTRYHLTPFRVVVSMRTMREGDKLNIKESTGVQDTADIPPD